MKPVLTPDISVAGAGIIGLAVALELQRRGASVVVLDTAAAGSGASTAAAGMLAAEDPHNPTELSELSRLSTLAGQLPAGVTDGREAGAFVRAPPPPRA